MKQMPLYKAIVTAIAALANCRKAGAVEWEERWEARIKDLGATLPSGSGLDTPRIDFDASNDNKIVFNTSYHHMNENGFYTHWTDHKITVVPSLMHDFDLKIGGRDHNEVKEYLHEVFATALSEQVELYPHSNIAKLESTLAKLH